MLQTQTQQMTMRNATLKQKKRIKPIQGMPDQNKIEVFRGRVKLSNKKEIPVLSDLVVS